MRTRKTLGGQIGDIQGRLDRSHNDIAKFGNLFANEVMRYIDVFLFCMVNGVRAPFSRRRIVFPDVRGLHLIQGLAEDRAR